MNVGTKLIIKNVGAGVCGYIYADVDEICEIEQDDMYYLIRTKRYPRGVFFNKWSELKTSYNLEVEIYSEETDMKWKDFNETDVFYCEPFRDVNDGPYLVRFKGNGRSEGIRLKSGNAMGDCGDFRSYKNYRHATNEEKVQFFTAFGYKSDTGEIWKVGDKFKMDTRGGTVKEIKDFMQNIDGVSMSVSDDNTCGYDTRYFDKSGSNGEYAKRVVEKPVEVLETNKYDSLISFLEDNDISESDVRWAFSPKPTSGLKGTSMEIPKQSATAELIHSYGGRSDLDTRIDEDCEIVQRVKSCGTTDFKTIHEVFNKLDERKGREWLKDPENMEILRKNLAESVKVDEDWQNFEADVWVGEETNPDDADLIKYKGEEPYKFAHYISGPKTPGSELLETLRNPPTNEEYRKFFEKQVDKKKSWCKIICNKLFGYPKV